MSDTENSGAGVGRAIFEALYEYVLITLPVGIYIALEAAHEQDPHLLYTTPKWAIATIFLVFQGGALHRYHIAAAGRVFSRAVIGLFSLAGLVVIITAAVNAYSDLDGWTVLSVTVRLALLLITSLTFILIVAGATFIHGKGD